MRRADLLVALRALEMLRALVLDQHPLVVIAAITVVAEDYRSVAFLLASH